MSVSFLRVWKLFIVGILKTDIVSNCICNSGTAIKTGLFSVGRHFSPVVLRLHLARPGHADGCSLGGDGFIWGVMEITEIWR